MSEYGMYVPTLRGFAFSWNGREEVSVRLMSFEMDGVSALCAAIGCASL